MDEAEARDRLTRLWLEHRPTVTAFARRRLPNHAVDDVVSEVFLVAWRRIAEVPADARGWLLAVTRNVILTHARTHGRWRALAVKVALEPPRTPPLTDDSAVEAVRLVEAWQRLTHGEREVLALAVWDGLTSAEAARVLGCLRSTYSVRLSRARRHFLDLLSDGAARAPDGPAPRRRADPSVLPQPQRSPR